MRPDRRGLTLFVAISLIPIFLLSLLLVMERAGATRREAHMRVVQTRLQYLAETGLEATFAAFRDSGGYAVTHQSDGTPAAGAAPLFPGVTRRSDGWWEWRWDPGDDPTLSLTGTGQSESFRIQVTRPDARSFRIVSRARWGTHRAERSLEGEVEPLTRYAFFADGDGVIVGQGPFWIPYQVHGPVHANGDLRVYHRLFSGAPVAFYGPTVSAAHEIQCSGGGPMSYVQVLRPDGIFAELTRRNSYYDSRWSEWTRQALSRYGGVVRDARLGARRLPAPRANCLLPSGYFASQAQLQLLAGSVDAAFFNQAEGREVRVKDLDVAALISAGGFPSNGMLYSEGPLRLKNAHFLPANLTVMCNASLYIQGDFNKERDATGALRKRSVGLIARDSVWLLSSGFNDAGSYSTVNPPASDPPLFAGDPANTIECNALVVEGRQPREGLLRSQVPGSPYYAPSNERPRQYAFLEDWTGQELARVGGTCWLDFRTMATFDNQPSQLSAGRSPWYVRADYCVPPGMTSERWDQAVELDPPPGFPHALSRRLLR